MRLSICLILRSDALACVDVESSFTASLVTVFGKGIVIAFEAIPISHHGASAQRENDGGGQEDAAHLLALLLGGAHGSIV
jgi:hypothetical protein